MGAESYEYKIKIESNKSQVHDIIVQNPPHKFFSSLPILLFLVFYAFISQGVSTDFHLLYLVFGTMFIILINRGAVVKESVVIIPSFGVQLETHYQSGQPLRKFVPMDKILKPMLVECVTPVTCYWTLSLMLRDEDELMVIFRDVKPPVMMLAFVWKALRDSTDPDDTSEPFPESFPESIRVPVHRTHISG